VQDNLDAKNYYAFNPAFDTRRPSRGCSTTILDSLTTAAQQAEETAPIPE